MVYCLFLGTAGCISSAIGCDGCVGESTGFYYVFRRVLGWCWILLGPDSNVFWGRSDARVEASIGCRV